MKRFKAVSGAAAILLALCMIFTACGSPQSQATTAAATTAAAATTTAEAKQETTKEAETTKAAETTAAATEKKTEAATTKAAETTAATEAETTKAPEAPGVNGPFTPFEEEYVVTAVYGYSGYDSNLTTPGTTPENNASNNILKEKLNIKVDWLWTVPSEQYEAKLNLSLAAGDVPDVLNVSLVQYRSLLDSGMLLDLTDDIETFMSDDIRAQQELTNRKMLKELTNSDGRMYAFPVGEDVLMQSIACYYRKDWADRLGLDAPKSMNDIYDMAVAFATGDPTGKGEKVWGIAANQDPYSPLSLGGVFWSFGSYPDKWILRDGKVVSGTTVPETLEALKMLRNLYAQGALNPEYATLIGSLVDEGLIASKYGIYYALWWSPNYPLNINLQNDYDAEWIGTPLLGPDGQMANNCNTERMSSGARVAFNTGKKRLGEALMKIINQGYDVNFVSNNERRKTVYPLTYLAPSDDPAYDPNATMPYQWYWWPVHIVPPSQYVQMFYDLNQAFKTGDKSLLRNSEYEQNYKAWQYLNGPDADRTNDLYGLYWGNWFSRACENGGMGTMIKHREAGKIIDNVYYGDPTPTEVERKTDIDTMVKEYFNRFIMGDVPESSWDGFVSDWNSMGGAKITEEVNAQYAALH